jgi:hypothetical protein
VRWLPATLLLVLAACEDGETVWVPFNFDPDDADSIDTLTVVVTSDEPAEAPEPVEIDLTSSTGRTVIGSALADPGTAVLGSLHDIVVSVSDDFEGVVGRATIAVEYTAGDLDGDGTPDVQVDEFDMRRDSADPGLYVLTLQSNGVVPGAQREDVFEVRLWQPEELVGSVSVDDVGGTPTTTEGSR